MDPFQEVQTRSEENGLNFYPTLREAIEAAEKDETIWKISFNASTGERIRLVKNSSEWLYQPIL